MTSSGRSTLLPRLLDVLLDVVDDPVDERVLEPFPDRLLPPGEIHLALRRTALHALRVLEQSLRRVGPTVEDQILDELEQLGRRCPRRPRAGRR